MTLLSAQEDFVVRTLGALQGCWARLIYAAQLRDENGRYSHWGLDRTYGGDKAQATIQQAHKDVFRKVLRQPIKELAHESVDSASAVAIGEKLIPQGAGRAAELHFNAVLFALVQLHNAKHRVA